MTSNFVIIVADLETGGLSSKANPVCEIACCAFNSSTLDDLKEYVNLIAPYDSTKTYTEGALKANGLSMDQIKAGVDAKIVVEELCEYFNSMKRGREKPVLAGQNFAKFDIPFLIELFKFHKKDLYSFVNETFLIDTLDWGHLRWVESANYKLGTLCANDNIELVDAHRALNDTRATKELVKLYIKKLRSESVEEQGSRYRVNFEF